MCFGPLLAAKAIYMKDSMSIKRSTISRWVMKLLERTVSASTLSVCRRDSANSILTLCPTLIFFLTSLENSTNTTKSWSSMIRRRTFGSWSQQMLPRAEVSSSSTTSMMWMLTNYPLYLDMLQIHCLLTVINLILESTYSSHVMSLWESIYFKRVWRDSLVRHTPPRLTRTISICISPTTASTRKMTSSSKMKIVSRTTLVISGR